MHTVTKFRADQTGATALVFGLLAPVLLVGAGAAISYTRASAARATEQSALDAAVLSGASLANTATDSDRIAVVRKKLSGALGRLQTIAQLLRRTRAASGFFELDQPHRHARCYKPLRGQSRGNAMAKPATKPKAEQLPFFEGQS